MPPVRWVESLGFKVHNGQFERDSGQAAALNCQAAVRSSIHSIPPAQPRCISPCIAAWLSAHLVASSAWSKKDNRISPSARHVTVFGSLRADRVVRSPAPSPLKSAGQYRTKVLVQYRSCFAARTVRANPPTARLHHPQQVKHGKHILPKAQVHMLPIVAASCSDLSARGETEGFCARPERPYPHMQAGEAGTNRGRQRGSTAHLGAIHRATADRNLKVPSPIPASQQSADGSKRIPARRHLCAQACSKRTPSAFHSSSTSHFPLFVFLDSIKNYRPQTPNAHAIFFPAKPTGLRLRQGDPEKRGRKTGGSKTGITCPCCPFLRKR